MSNLLRLTTFITKTTHLILTIRPQYLLVTIFLVVTILFLDYDEKIKPELIGSGDKV